MQEKTKWILMSEMYPPLGEPLIVTIKNHLSDGRRELRYPVYLKKEGYDSYLFCHIEGYTLSDACEVIAWMYFPDPYEDDI